VLLRATIQKLINHVIHNSY